MFRIKGGWRSKIIIKCLICNKIFKSDQALGCHVKLHNITSKEYKEKFGLIPKCPTCEKEVVNSISGYCGHCRDRHGENNPFYGKNHKKEVIENLKISSSIASKRNWENQEYRDRVIKAISKPRRIEFGKEQSNRVSQWYKDNPQQLQIRSKSMKKSWENGKIIANGYSCNRSKIQENLLKEIEQIYGEEIPNRTVRLENGRYLFPDIFIDNLGLVIEFYGNFWHANPKFYKSTETIYNNLTAKDIWDDDERRIQKFSSALDLKGNPVNYKVEIVWEYDYLNNKENILKRFDNLINWEGCSI